MPAERAGGWSGKVPGLEQQGGHCLVVLHKTLNSKQPRGDGTRVSRILVPTIPGDAHRGAERTHAAEGVLCPFSSYARETACSSAGSWQLWGLPATGSCFVFLKEKLWRKR